MEARNFEAETTLAPLTSGFEVMYQYGNISWKSMSSLCSKRNLGSN